MKWQRSRLALAALLALPLLAALALGLLYVRQSSLPVYAEGELPPAGGYATNTLTRGDRMYVSGKAEFRMRPMDSTWPRWATGRTPGGERQIYPVAGQSPANYIYTTGDMMAQTVYRDVRVPPVAPAGMHVSEMRLAGGPALGPERRSRDAAAMAEVVDSLALRQTVRLAPNYEAGDRGYRLDLLPEQAPGLAYTVDVLIDTAGRVYLSDETELNQDVWIPAGPRFTRWALP